jgi:hypothetical protein
MAFFINSDLLHVICCNVVVSSFVLVASELVYA